MRTRRGIALPILVMLILLLVGIVISLGFSNVQTLSNVALDTYNKQAYYAAEEGLAASLHQIKGNTAWSAGFSNTPCTVHTSWSYSVVVTNNYTGAAPLQAADGTTVPVGDIYLRASGQSTNNVVMEVSEFIRRGSVFAAASQTQVFVDLNGVTKVDGWDSSLGPYVPPPTPQKNAPVNTNGTQNGAITLGGTSLVDGNVTVGPGANLATAISGTNYTGTAAAAPSLIAFPPVVSPLSGSGSNINVGAHGVTVAPPGVYGSVNVSGGGTLTLTSGTYLFTGDVSFTGNSTLNILAATGPVIVYVAGQWDSSGGIIVNLSQRPQNFQLYGTATNTSIKLQGGSGAYMAVYSPNANITVSGNSDLFGSFSGNSMTYKGNGALHYDVSLANGVGPPLWNTVAYNRWGR